MQSLISNICEEQWLLHYNDHEVMGSNPIGSFLLFWAGSYEKLLFSLEKVLVILGQVVRAIPCFLAVVVV